jgi:hypothetical protein
MARGDLKELTRREGVAAPVVRAVWQAVEDASQRLGGGEAPAKDQAKDPAKDPAKVPAEGGPAEGGGR